MTPPYPKPFQGERVPSGRSRKGGAQDAACHIFSGQKKWTAERSDGGPKGGAQDAPRQDAIPAFLAPIFPPFSAALKTRA